MMLVRHHGGNRVMIWREFGRFLGGRRVWQRPLQRVLGRATEFVEPVAGRAVDGCLKLVMLGKATEFVGPGADGRRLLERCSHGTQDKFAIVSMAKEFLHCFIGACMHGCRCIFCGGILCIDSWCALFVEVVRGCGC